MRNPLKRLFGRPSSNPRLPDTFELHVWVTREDIAKGQTSDPYRCPIALALKRALREQFSVTPAYLTVSVTGGRFFVMDHGKAVTHTAKWPDGIAEFILDFDTHDEVEPFDFTATFTLAGYTPPSDA